MAKNSEVQHLYNKKSESNSVQQIEVDWLLSK